jgi:hypothetical protein
MWEMQIRLILLIVFVVPVSDGNDGGGDDALPHFQARSAAHVPGRNCANGSGLEGPPEALIFGIGTSPKRNTHFSTYHSKQLIELCRILFL